MLIGMKKKESYLTTDNMRGILEMASPDCKTWTSDDIGNMRKKIDRLAIEMNPDDLKHLATFETQFKSTKIQDLFVGKNGDASC